MSMTSNLSANPRLARPIRVLIIDDSALVRRLVHDMLASDPDIEVVGTAGDALIARERIKELNPDVLTLDVEMPRMDGLTFLRNLMRLRPMPVVMVSSLTEHGVELTLEALSIGAVDYLPKPKMDISATLAGYRDELIVKIKTASRARVVEYQTPKRSPDAKVMDGSIARHFRTTDQIIAIGASTGGTEAIKDVLVNMPADAPGIVVTQHIPKLFSGAFARRLDSISAMNVCEAQDGQQVLRGHAYVAPGDAHLLVVRDGARYCCRLDHGPPVNRHKPSVDVMFRSVAEHVGRNAVGVILTGMGKDGAAGLKEMREAGGLTIAQDETSCVVWGMPREAFMIGAAMNVLPLQHIHSRILDHVTDAKHPSPSAQKAKL